MPNETFLVGVSSLEHDHTINAANQLNETLSGYSERAIKLHNFATEHKFGPKTLLVAKNSLSIELPRMDDTEVRFMRSFDVGVQLDEGSIDVIGQSKIPLDEFLRRSWRLSNYVIMNAGVRPSFINQSSIKHPKIKYSF